MPCGVESGSNVYIADGRDLFLMCRVELKASSAGKLLINPSNVPNVPCGVERRPCEEYPQETLFQFLMCRVELKVPQSP